MATYVYTASFATIYPSIPLTASPTGGTGGTPTVWDWDVPPGDGRWAPTASPVNDVADNGGPGNPGSPLVVISSGESVLSGHGAPPAWAGHDGDYWMNVDATTLYGPRVAGAWPATGTSLIGGSAVTGSAIQVAAPTGVAATDQAAINAAIAALPPAGGVVQLQAGTYVVPAPASVSSGCVNMTVNNSVLRGMGMGVTTIQLAPGSAGVTGIARTPSGVANSKITFADFTIDGNAAAQTGSPTVIGFYCGVTPNSTLTDTDITLSRVEVKNCIGYGFDPHERTTRLTMIGCVSHDNGTDLAHDGFTLDACYDTVLIGCKAYNNGRHGFNLVTASTRVQLIGCESYGNTGNGYIAQNGAKYAQLNGCLAYNNTGAGFVINGVPQTGQQDNTPGGMHSLTGCTAWQNGTHGYQLVGTSYNRLTGCHSQDASNTTTNTSDHYRIDESGTTYSTTNTLSSCTWAQTSGVANAAKYGVQEKSANDGPTYVLGCSGTGTATGSLNLLNATSALLAAHNGTSGGHPAEFAYAFDTPARHGYKEWNYPPDLQGAAGGAAMVGGTIYGMRIDAQAGQPVSNIVINVGTAGTSMTAAQCYASLIDGTTGTELARTGDIATALQGTGPTPLPLTAGFTPAIGQKLAVMLVANTAGVMPQLVRSSSTGVGGPDGGQSGASPRRYFTAGTTQTSMPSSFAMASTATTGALTFWCGLS